MRITNRRNKVRLSLKKAVITRPGRIAIGYSLSSRHKSRVGGKICFLNYPLVSHVNWSIWAGVG